MSFLRNLGIGTDSTHYGNDYFWMVFGEFCDRSLLLRLRNAHTIFETLKNNDAHLSSDGRIRQLFNYFADLYFKRLCMMIHSRNVMEAEYEIISSVSQDESRKPAFYFNLHLNSFYMHLAAFLDNVAWFLNFLYQLGYREDAQNRTGCGLEKNGFINRIRPRKRSIADILTTNRDWIIENVHPKRHPVAHRLSLEISTITEVDTGRTYHTLILPEEWGHKIVTGYPVQVVNNDFNKAIEIFSQATGAISISEIESLF